ncbi:hypothetical protein EGY28_10730 [Burkholderia dolosa]|nr:hypothetical protein EGY28_10730 [Burkholderia dolosa]
MSGSACDGASPVRMRNSSDGRCTPVASSNVATTSAPPTRLPTSRNTRPSGVSIASRWKLPLRMPTASSARLVQLRSSCVNGTW